MNTRCHHNNWAIGCDTCELESLHAKYAAVCDELEQVQNELNESDCDLSREIDARDYWEEKATELAHDVGKFFDVDFGDHSSHNCPVQNAIDYVFWKESS